ncbi:uncharacterized protein LOC116340234 [Contarinia nasturtii]|uniref:uncharacterized protein LOC116340234 n=1 Tax=Contarinia nasturtii TaxID=265458 RepID=UPI0012D47E42|nr:uncharacterized protein LOC116340234 [Contarinia nasturtii]
MIRITLILIGTVAVLNVVSAANENVTIEQIYDMASNILNATDKWQEELKEYSVEGRKSKLFPFLLPFHALWGFGGLHALGILFAIKFKIIIVASIIAFAVYYYAKFVAVKKCHGDHLREGSIYPLDSTYTGSSYYHSPVTSYSSPLDISSHISYPSVEPFSGYHGSAVHSDIPSYAFDHHDHHDDFHDHHHDYHHDFDHHSHDFENYFPDHPHDISSPPGGDSPLPPSSTNDGKDSPDNSPPTMSATYRRVGKHRRRRATRPQIDFIDIGELAFRFLGVDTEGCRKRFVCELDFRARANPITRLAFSFIGRNFFERYRILDKNIAKPKKFSDCSKAFNDCKDAEKYNDVDDDDEQEEQASTTENPDTQEENDKEGGGDSSQDEESSQPDNEINNVRSKRTYKPIRI